MGFVRYNGRYDSTILVNSTSFPFTHIFSTLFKPSVTISLFGLVAMDSKYFLFSSLIIFTLFLLHFIFLFSKDNRRRTNTNGDGNLLNKYFLNFLLLLLLLLLFLPFPIEIFLAVVEE